MSDFEELYEEHYQRLYTLAFRMTGNREDAEDVLQSSLMNAYRAFEKFSHQSSVYTWLYRIVLNTAKRFCGDCRRLPAIEYSEKHGISQQEFYSHINSFGRVEDEVLTALTRETCLQMFMNCMPSKYRAVYTLRVILKFSIAETADILAVSGSSVKVNLHRARRIAQSHIDERCSLIHPGSMCDCRSYAGFIASNGRGDILSDIEVIENKEKSAIRKYSAELSEIIRIDAMYDNQIKAPDHGELIARVKRLKSEGRLRLLGD